LLKAERIASYKERAAAEAKEAKWTEMPGTPRNVVSDLRGHWGAISRQQYFNVMNLRAVNFPKAALFLLSCELALQELINQQESVIPFTSGACIYQHMAIIPACWNINDFNTEYLNRQTKFNSTFLNELANHVSQSDPEVFKELAAGHTVTFRTANGIKHYCNGGHGREPLGKIRSRAGRNLLGTKRAADCEELGLS
jgi:hypothetical protein